MTMELSRFYHGGLVPPWIGGGGIHVSKNPKRGAPGNLSVMGHLNFISVSREHFVLTPATPLASRGFSLGNAHDVRAEWKLRHRHYRRLLLLYKATVLGVCNDCPKCPEIASRNSCSHAHLLDPVYRLDSIRPLHRE